MGKGHLWSFICFHFLGSLGFLTLPRAHLRWSTASFRALLNEQREATNSPMCCPRIGGKICVKTRPCRANHGKSIVCWDVPNKASLFYDFEYHFPARFWHIPQHESVLPVIFWAHHTDLSCRDSPKRSSSQLGNWSSRWMVGQMEIYSVYNYINNYTQKDYQSRLAVYNNHHPFNFIVQYLKTISRWQGPKHGHGQKKQVPMGPCQGWYISEWASRPAANAVAPPSGSGVTRNIEDAAVIILSSQYHCGHNFHQPSCHINISVSILISIAYRVISYEYHINIYYSIYIYISYQYQVFLLSSKWMPTVRGDLVAFPINTPRQSMANELGIGASPGALVADDSGGIRQPW